MNCITVLGARPQFIKAGPVSRALAARGISERLLHTGQHYDASMSDVFFEELDLARPSWHLGFGGGTHGAMTGAMLSGIEKILLEENPDAVLVYGDTNSTLAGALAAAKLHMPVAHVEAGLRSFNKRMPEEINRICTDHVSRWLFCSSETSVEQLGREGITEQVYNVGDVMFESLEWAIEKAAETPGLLPSLIGGLAGKDFLLMTIHRAENTDDPARLSAIVSGIESSPLPIIMPLHPRTRGLVAKNGLHFPAIVHLIDPVGYLGMAALLRGSAAVLTDSGGLQKEAYWAGKPCLTLRDQTEWTETVEVGWNRLVGTDAEAIRAGFAKLEPAASRPPLYGDGLAAHRIAAVLAA